MDWLSFFSCCCPFAAHSHQAIPTLHFAWVLIKCWSRVNPKKLLWEASPLSFLFVAASHEISPLDCFIFIQRWSFVGCLIFHLTTVMFCIFPKLEFSLLSLPILLDLSLSFSVISQLRQKPHHCRELERSPSSSNFASRKTQHTCKLVSESPSFCAHFNINKPTLNLLSFSGLLLQTRFTIVAFWSKFRALFFSYFHPTVVRTVRFLFYQPKYLSFRSHFHHRTTHAPLVFWFAAAPDFCHH